MDTKLKNKTNNGLNPVSSGAPMPKIKPAKPAPTELYPAYMRVNIDEVRFIEVEGIAELGSL